VVSSPLSHAAAVYLSHGREEVEEGGVVRSEWLLRTDGESRPGSAVCVFMCVLL
jgi:hypothetical protein